MHPASFAGYDLRTTDPEGAARFYTEVAALDLDASSGGPSPGAPDGHGLRITALPDRARAAGAPAHWLGRIAVDDLRSTLVALEDRGVQPLGPPETRDGEVTGRIVRDPGGAVIGFVSAHGNRTPVADPDAGGGPVCWHELHTPDPEDSWSFYRTLCRWVATDPIELGGELGTYRTFAPHEGAESIGGIADTARRPGVHPHWLYSFPVAELDASSSLLERLGGELIGRFRSGATGARGVVAHDPQGAIFGLMETSAPSPSPDSSG